MGYGSAKSAPGLLPPDLIKPPLATPIKTEIKLIKFDPYGAEVRMEGRRWQLWSGRTMLKDFGDNRNAAYEARRLVAELKLTERGAIGTPTPVMEYWLSDGQAPPLPSFGRNVIPFEPAGVKVLEDNGSFCVGDDRHVLFNFGPYADDAQRALEVIRRYDFNEIGFIGRNLIGVRTIGDVRIGDSDGLDEIVIGLTQPRNPRDGQSRG